MSWAYLLVNGLLSGALVLAIFIYLIAALFYPERF
ncbi:MAG: K(+)-transporting ATPase subunit F [Methylovulum sp.]|nr:K(+)-transporting ATPase subunit F [Methylovulum sp.]